MIAMALLACGESSARAAPVDEQEQRRMEWARQRAVSRIFSIEEMRQYLRSAGDDEARAEECLPQLDELTRKAGGSRALQLVDMYLRQRNAPRPSEVIYQEYQDGKLTYEVTARLPMCASCPWFHIQSSRVRKLSPAVIAANVERRRNGGG